jgi:hypothetical protein
MNTKVKIGLVIAAVLILSALGLYGSLYVFTSPSIRQPTFTHHHFRMQLIIDGEKVDFGEDRFQEPTPGGNICNAGLTETPIHFHDNKDQIVHIHWGGISGGQVLKYYGLNLIGGNDDHLGYQFEDAVYQKRVDINGRHFGNIQEEILQENKELFVYTGDENSFNRVESKDFLDKTLEDFFEADLPYQKPSQTTDNLLTFWSLPVTAHEHQDQENHEDQEEYTQEELKELNHLIGNVVIFVQDQEPTEDQVKERFDNLEPLAQSICGG